MELNSKKLESTSRIIYYSISIILCIFLILLSNRIIDDLDKSTERPEVGNFENKLVLGKHQNEVKGLSATQETLSLKEQMVNKTIAAARANYENEKQSFDNWVKTRTTLGSPDKDQEVVVRARRLDEYYKVEQDWRAQLGLIQDQIAGSERKKEGILLAIANEYQLAQKQYEKAFEHYNLQIFLIRLLFVIPILALGIYFFIKFRRHKFWPIYFGFTLFSFYAFFFGLVPYLPSYGGYVRYSVGILLSGGLGYYSIRRIRLYMEQKQSELKSSTQERAKKVHGEVAEKALENHFCPSCGKDFIMKKWEFPLPKITESEAYKVVTDFCRHCGLVLFKKCNTCGHKNFAHLPFCASCGSKPEEKSETSL